MNMNKHHRTVQQTRNPYSLLEDNTKRNRDCAHFAQLKIGRFHFTSGTVCSHAFRHECNGNPTP